MKHELIQLPYAVNALEPAISKQTIDFLVVEKPARVLKKMEEGNI